MTLRACSVYSTLIILTVAALYRTAGAGDTAAKKGGTALEEFPACLYCVTLSPDGKTLAVGGSDFPGPSDFLVVDLASGQKQWVSSKHRMAVWSLAFSPDGKLLASASDGGEVNLWDAATGKHRAALVGHRGCVNGLKFTPDSKALISKGYEGCVKIWDVATEKAQATFRFPFREKEKAQFYGGPPELPEEHAKLTVDFKEPIDLLYGVALSPDGKTLAAATLDKEVKLWSVETGKEVTVIVTDHKDGAIDVVFSPDGKLLATGGGRKDGSIRLWDIKTGKRVGVLEGHKHSVLGLAFTPDGKTLVSVSCDGTSRIWDVQSQKERAAITPKTDDSPHGFALSPDGKWFVTAGGVNSVRRYSTEDGKELPIGE